MDIKKLLSGVAVIIDDRVNDLEGNDKILQIVRILEKNHIPLLKYESLPDDDETRQLKNISFILLDWDLKETIEVESNSEIDIVKSGLNDYDDNIKFLKIIKENTFVPIFIFSRLDPDTITRKLSDENLYNSDSANVIFVKRKGDLISKDEENEIFLQIKGWLEKTPSLYVLKEWEQSLYHAKHSLFWSFYDINHYWPAVLQKSFTDDGSDVIYELGSFIFKNIMARTEPIKFDNDIIKLENDEITENDIRKILEAERFIKNDALPDIPFTGDLFEYEVDVNSSKENRYYLNVRPECDIAIREGGTGNPDLYCLKGGKIVDEELINSEKKEHKDKRIDFVKGSLIEQTNRIFLPFIIDGRIIEFHLNEIKIKKWNSLKKTRIGRLLPPYITKVQQQYSFYLQRQGLPAIPEKAISR